MLPCSKRLQAILDCIHGSVLADIGCDHGIVCVNAILSQRVKKAYACDIAEGPLQKAKETIRLTGVQNDVTCVQMNGIEALADDVDIVVIAGMGAKTIVSILDNANRLEGIQFIVSPHNDTQELRKYLQDNHFYIDTEQMVYDANHYYPILCVRYTPNQTQKMTSWEIEFGKNCVESKDYLDYLLMMEKKYKHLLTIIPKDKQESIQKKYNLLRKKDTL